MIEDCAQAHGARYKGRPVGRFGDVGAFSFCQDKIITTGGEGGMLVTDDASCGSRPGRSRTTARAMTRSTSASTRPGFRWLHESFGTNWRMTEMQSAIGRAQLAQAGWLVRGRRRNAGVLARDLSRVPGLRLTAPGQSEHAYYKYYAFVRPKCCGRVGSGSHRAGARCRGHTLRGWRLQRNLSGEGVSSMRPPKRLPVARALADTSLMFMLHPGLTEPDMRDSARAVEKSCAWRCAETPGRVHATNGRQDPLEARDEPQLADRGDDPARCRGRGRGWLLAYQLRFNIEVSGFYRA